MISNYFGDLKNFFKYSKPPTKSVEVTRDICGLMATGFPWPLRTVCPDNIKTPVTYLKLASICDVPFAIAEMIKLVYLFNRAQAKKNVPEAIVFSSCFCIQATKVFDTLTTFVNAILTLTSKNPKQIFPSAALPIAFFINGGGTLLGSYSIYKLSYSEAPSSKKMMKLHGAYMISNLIVISGLVLFKRGIADSRPASLLALSNAIRIACEVIHKTK